MTRSVILVCCWN